jgi:hypothetical protein
LSWFPDPAGPAHDTRAWRQQPGEVQLSTLSPGVHQQSVAKSAPHGACQGTVLQLPKHALIKGHSQKYFAGGGGQNGPKKGCGGGRGFTTQCHFPSHRGVELPTLLATSLIVVCAEGSQSEGNTTPAKLWNQKSRSHAHVPRVSARFRQTIPAAEAQRYSFWGKTFRGEFVISLPNSYGQFSV